MHFAFLLPDHGRVWRIISWILVIDRARLEAFQLSDLNSTRLHVRRIERSNCEALSSGFADQALMTAVNIERASGFQWRISSILSGTGND
jgi:hypothetical protein